MLGRPLRLAIVTDRARLPRQGLDALRKALDGPGIEIVGVFRVRPIVPGLGGALGGGLFTGLDRFEDLVERLRGRCLAGDEPVALACARVSTVAAPWRRSLALTDVAGRRVPTPQAQTALRQLDLDVLIVCTQAPLALPAGLVRHGAFGIETGRGVPAFAPWAGAAELARGSPVLSVRVIDYAAPAAVEHYRATLAMDEASLRKIRLKALSKGIAALGRLLRSLDAGDAGGNGNTPPAATRSTPTPVEAAGCAAPSVPLFIQTALAMGRRWLNNRRAAGRQHTAWHLAYCFSDRPLPEIEYERLRYLAPAPGTFWADPFALHWQGRHYILFEELPYASGRGRLRAVEVFEDRPAGPPMTVLERDHHLSYPQVFAWQDVLYMVPETRQAGRVELLRCVEFPACWALEKVLLDGVQAVDATVHHHAGRWWLFANLAADGLGAADELHLFHADALLGDWQAHPANPISTDIRCARPAGPLFEAGGALYRPSQDGSARYGGALWINRIERLDPQAYAERPAHYLAPDWHPDIETVHTLGRASRLTVLDCVVNDRGGLDIQRRAGQAA